MVIEKDIIKKYADFIDRAKKTQRYIFIVENTDIKKLNELSYEYTIALKHTAKHFKGNAATLFVEDLFDEVNIPNQYAVSIAGIENTPPIYVKQIASIIGRRVMMEFRTILPITSEEIFNDAFKSTSLPAYLQNYGVILRGV